MCSRSLTVGITIDMKIRQYEARDSDDVIHLSLRAWAPVFVSIEKAMQPDVYKTLYPDGWRASQQTAVTAAIKEQRVWVAERDDAVVGFVSVVPHHDDKMGEVHMVAVDPEYQRNGIGKALIDKALDWMRENGLEVVMVETGGDPGHAPARQMYERAGFELLPIARYFRKL